MPYWKVIDRSSGKVIYEYNAPVKTDLEGLPTKDIAQVAVPNGVDPDSVIPSFDSVLRRWTLIQDPTVVQNLKRRYFSELREGIRKRMRDTDWALLPGARLDAATIQSFMDYRDSLRTMPSSILDPIEWMKNPTWPVPPPFSELDEIDNPNAPKSVALGTSSAMMSVVQQDSGEEQPVDQSQEGTIAMKRFTLQDASNPAISRQIEAESIAEIDSADLHNKIVTEEDITAEYNARLKLKSALQKKPVDLAQEIMDLKEAVAALAKYDNSKALALIEKEKQAIMEIHQQAKEIAAMPQLSKWQKFILIVKSLFIRK